MAVFIYVDINGEKLAGHTTFVWLKKMWTNERKRTSDWLTDWLIDWLSKATHDTQYVFMLFVVCKIKLNTCYYTLLKAYYSHFFLLNNCCFILWN